MKRQDLALEDTLRYKRNILLKELGSEGQRRLKESSVLIVGIGGLGSPVSLYLAAAGIGHIGMVDYDHVSMSNLQRQIIYETGDVGRKKVESAREKILRLNPYVQLDAYMEVFDNNTAKRIADNFDILIDGTDNFPARYLLNDTAVFGKKPYIYGSVYRFEGQVSTFDAQNGPCYRCLFSEPPSIEIHSSSQEEGIFNVLPGTIGTIQAAEAIKLILKIGEPLIGRILLYDSLSMNFQIVQFSKNPICKACSSNPTITDLTP